MAYVDEVLADGPGLYWRLNETAGTVADDATANALDGTHSNVTVGADPLILSETGSKAASYDGTSSLTERASATAIQTSGTGHWTVEAWINPATVTGLHEVAAKHSRDANSGVYGGWELIQDHDRIQMIRVLDNTGATTVNTAWGVLAIGTTTHVVGTYDGATVRVYLNGALAAEGASTINSALESEALRVGATRGNGTTGTALTRFFSGRIDEFAFYKTALSAARIKAHYDAGIEQAVSISLTAPIATSTADAPAPSVVTNAHLDAPTATATADAPAPIIGTGSTVEAPLATATADAPAPHFGLGWIAEPNVAEFSASAFAPTLASADEAYTDFHEYPTNAAPVGWSGSADATVQDNNLAVGGKVYSFPDAKTVFRYRTWDIIGSVADASATTRMRSRQTSGGGYVGVAIRVQGDGSCYFLGYSPSSTENNNTQFGLRKIAPDGTATTLHNATLTGIATPSMKIETEGSVVRAKYWLGDVQEPTAWNFEFTDTAPLPAGGAGLATWQYGSASSTASPAVLFDTFDFTSTVGLTRLNPIKPSLQWNVLPDTTVYAGLRWQTFNEVATSRQTIWKSGEFTTLTVSTSLAWSQVARVDTSRSYLWHTYRAVPTVRTVRWDTLSVVSRTRTVPWRVLNTVQSQRVIPWNLRALVRADRHLFWEELLPVTITSEVRWITNGDDSIVSKPLSLKWKALTTTAAAKRSVLWLSTVSGNLADANVITFAGHPTGLTPHDWSAETDDLYVAGGADAHWKVAERADAIGGKVLRSINPEMSVIRWKGEPSNTDQDVTLRIQSAASLNFWVRPAHSVWQYPDARYQVKIAKAGGDAGLVIQRTSGLTPKLVTSAPSPAFQTSQWMWVRFQNKMNENTSPRLRQVKVKIWFDGTPEPADWNATLTDSEGASTAWSSYTNVTGYFAVSGEVDLDWIGFVQPDVSISAPPARVGLSAGAPTYGLTKQVFAPVGRVRFTPPHPTLEIGDQVLMSWFAFEVPAAVATAADLFAPIIRVGLAGLVPDLAIQKNHGIEVPTAFASASTIPPFQVRAEIGVRAEVEVAAMVAASAPAPELRIFTDVFVGVESTGKVALAGAEPTLRTERNVRAQVETTGDARLNVRRPTLLGSFEARVENVKRATFTVPQPIKVLATLAVYPPTATATATALEPTLRVSVRIQMNTLGVASMRSIPAEVIRTDSKVYVPTGRASMLAQPAQVIRVGWTEFALVARADLQARLPEVNAVITPDNVYLAVENVGVSGGRALAPEFRFTPAEVGDAVVVYLGALRAEVRLGVRKSDVYLGSTRASVVIAEVRDEVKA